MTRQVAVADVNAFVKGLITEASPLTFPENASIDEMNIVINKDGSRRRRLGLDYEDSYVTFDSNSAVTEDLAFSSYMWKAPGGYTDKEFLIVQSGIFITVIDATKSPISGSVLQRFSVGGDSTTQLAITSVDGIAVVTSSSGSIYAIDYDGVGLSISSDRLKIRDSFGVADSVEGVNLLEGNGIQFRPTSRTDNHIYNLRNQTFAYPRYRGSGENQEVATCPIFSFFDTAVKYPANSDNLNTYLYANANDSEDRTSKRYFQKDNMLNPLGTNRAPAGFFIIDALSRGASRLQAVQSLYSQYPELQYPISVLPTDFTPGGAACVGTYAGRVWFGGFSSQVVDGDSQSPRMTSYVLFSRLVKNVADIYKCYQEGDPTSADTPDLVDTDGGFIRLDGAYNIQKILNVGETLMVIAENGVWQITGGSGYGFKATDYKTVKITEHGSISPGSVIIIDNTLMYWSDDGIYHVKQNQYGDWIASNLTATTIQRLFDDIPYTVKVRCQSNYDSYQHRVRWLYNNYFGAAGNPKELIFDTNLAAFYQSEIKSIDSEFPKPLCIVKVPSFVTTEVDYTVINSVGDTVISSSGDTVASIRESVVSQTSELMYVVADRIENGHLYLTFGYYKDDTFVDWASKDGVGVDASGYLLTGWTSAGDYQRMKQVPYLTVYSVKTETGFDSFYKPINPSSIIVQGQWGWTNLAASGKWTNKMQVYRHKRFWTPSGPSSGFDDGESVIVTKNRLRGRGRVLSLLFETEPGKDFYLLGWSYLLGMSTGV